MSAYVGQSYGEYSSVWAGSGFDGFLGRTVVCGYRDCWFLVMIAVPGRWSGPLFAYQNGQVYVSRELDGDVQGPWVGGFAIRT